MTAPGYNGEGTRFPLTIVRGADMAFDLTATSGGLPLDLSGATIEPELYDISDNLVTSLTHVVSGADSNVLTLSFPRASATALSQSRYLWTLWITRGGDRHPWFAGQVTVTNGRKGQGGATSGSYTVTVDGDVTVSVDVNGGAGGGGSSVTIQASAPSSPSVGDLWVDSDDLALYTYYDDGNSSQWVAIGGPAGPAGTDGVDGVDASTVVDGGTAVSPYGGTSPINGGVA
jgi:hypothetical protein